MTVPSPKPPKWRSEPPSAAAGSTEANSLADELLASDPKFQQLVAKSKASPRKPFRVGDEP
jgi:hypothetical protein